MDKRQVLISIEQWRDDLRFMVGAMLDRHPNPFAKTPRHDIEASVESLYQRIPSLERHQIIVEFTRIVALLGDGHTAIPWRDPSIGFRRYPLELLVLEDVLFVRGAEKTCRDMVGKQIVQIGALDAEAAIRRMQGVACVDNEWAARAAVQNGLVTPEALHALGICEPMNKSRFAFLSDGVDISREMQPVEEGGTQEWLDASDLAGSPRPLWLKHADDPFWFEYQPDSAIVYFQFNAVCDKAEETFAHFCTRLFAFIDANRVEKLVIDIRRNGGGNGGLNWPLIYGLIRCEKLNQWGKLFTLIGGGTFSAAVMCAAWLERHTRTLFVGEPTAAGPNHYGNAVRVLLPNSQLPVWISEVYWQEGLPWDKRRWIAPDLLAPMTAEAYCSNIDPAWNAVQNYSESAQPAWDPGTGRALGYPE